MIPGFWLEARGRWRSTAQANENICYFKPDKDYIAFGFSEIVNPRAKKAPPCIPSHGPCLRWTRLLRTEFAVWWRGPQAASRDASGRVRLVPDVSTGVTVSRAHCR